LKCDIIITLCMLATNAKFQAPSLTPRISHSFSDRFTLMFIFAFYFYSYYYYFCFCYSFLNGFIVVIGKICCFCFVYIFKINMKERKKITLFTIDYPSNTVSKKE
jgi:hypothetical protein